MMSDADTLVEKRNGESSLQIDESASIRILHVEDDDTIAAVAKEMLEGKGWQVETCSDGRSALEKIDSNLRYDFVLVDYDLPDVNGLELVNHTRKLAHRSETPIGMLSANPVEAEAREAGANVFLRKPQDIVSLPEAITRLLCERRH
jgi:CheY-like chemotaxis protein